MNVLVNGMGTIGSTLIHLLYDFKDSLGIDQVYALKNTVIKPWQEQEMNFFKSKGIQICVPDGSRDHLSLCDIEDKLDYIFDCTSSGFGLKNKAWYQSLPQLKGASAQGSEKGFGLPYMLGVNDQVIEGEPFVQIVSCNTHGITSLIWALGAGDLSLIAEGDFVVVRRSEDLGKHKKLVSANVVSRHLDKTLGTHHAVDVHDLLSTLQTPPPLHSSDITTPSQLLHSVRFNIKMKEPFKESDLMDRLKKNPYLAFTSRFDSSEIFEWARRYGPYGRAYAHAIVVENNVLVDAANHRLKGWAFIPQEGNTVLSTLSAFLIQMKVKNSHDIIQRLEEKLIVTKAY